jgi:hypothetical protein
MSSTASALRDRLDGLEAQTDADAEHLRSAYREAVDRIEGDAELTPAARRQRSDEQLAQSRERMSELRVDYEQRRHELHRIAYLAAFGAMPKGAEIAYRDAYDRASRIDDQSEAARELRRARSRGDRLLESAVAEHSLRRGWKAALNEFVDGDERRIELVGLLRELGPESGEPALSRRRAANVFRWAVR